MSVICLVAESLERGPGGVLERLLEVVPRVAVEGELVWADGRGLSAARAARAARAALKRAESVGGRGVRAGIAAVPVVAEVAAECAQAGEVARVAEGGDAAFLAGRPLTVLQPTAELIGMLDAVGVRTCGELAALPREAVEVRFGGDAVTVWRHARADDARRLFGRPALERPNGSIDFIDYVVTDPERLIFAANALLGGVCTTLAERGAHARAMTLVLPLANGESWRRMLRPARPTASRAAWLRLARAVLERLTVPDAVIGVELEVDALEPAVSVQGDLFDRGFGTASAAESAVARLLETQGPVIVRAETSAHPLAERRIEAAPIGLEAVAGELAAPAVAVSGGEVASSVAEVAASPVELTLQVLREPRPVHVETTMRRDHTLPVRYRDGRWRRIVNAAGPERISGGQWEAVPYAREYYRAVNEEGSLVWLFRDGRDGGWYLHGWWD